MNLTETISVLDQKEKELLAEIEKVRTAKSMIKSIFNHSSKGSIKQVKVTSKRSRVGINANLNAAKSQVLPLIDSTHGITLESIRKKAVSIEGNPYSENTVKAYLSALSSEDLIKKRKGRYFRIS
jgi:hypothetical protein